MTDTKEMICDWCKGKGAQWVGNFHWGIIVKCDSCHHEWEVVVKMESTHGEYGHNVD